MKNYLLLLKQALIKNKGCYILKNEQNEEQKSKQDEKIEDETQLIFNIVNKLGLEFSKHRLEKIANCSNRFSVGNDKMIFLYPPNDGMPTCSFEFFKGEKLIISNRNAYSEITNLDEILLQMVRIFNKSLDDGIVLDPYYFMLKLTGDIKKNYRGEASLVITEKAIRNQKLNEQNFDEATKYFINHFLDHFIGWNFGISVNRNEMLKNELELLNEKVIDKGIRKYTGPGFEVYGIDSKACNGLQHYYLPVEKSIVKKKVKD